MKRTYSNDDVNSNNGASAENEQHRSERRQRRARTSRGAQAAEAASPSVPAPAPENANDEAQTAYRVPVGIAKMEVPASFVSWAMLQVLQDIAVQMADNNRLRLAPESLSVEERMEMGERANAVRARYTGSNDVFSIRDPVSELRELWERLNENPLTSFCAQPPRSKAAPSSTAANTADSTAPQRAASRRRRHD